MSNPDQLHFDGEAFNSQPIEKYILHLIKDKDPDTFFPFPVQDRLPDNVIELRPHTPDEAA